MLTRRALLTGGLGLAGALALPGESVLYARGATPGAGLPQRPPVSGGRIHDLTFTTGQHLRPDLVPAASKAPLWLYNNTLFPVVRVNLGDTLRARLENHLPEHTAMHWHGVRVPNAMDGVQYITQPPIEPGESFTYEFKPPDTGTFFFHSHCDGVQQMGRGLIGILLVDGDQPVPFDDEKVLVAKDWRLSKDGEWLPFETLDGAGRAGTFGTVRATNGVEAFSDTVPADGAVRMRILNLDSTRMMQVGVEGAEAFVIATDGNAITPFPLDTWKLGSAMRLDILVRTPPAGKSFRILDYFAAEPWPIAAFTAKTQPRRWNASQAIGLYAADVPKPDLASAQRLEFQFSAAASGSAAAAAASQLPPDDPLAKALLDSQCIGSKGLWAINQVQWPNDGHRKLPPPLAVLERGRSYVFELMNATPHPHPIHLHGHTFTVLSASRQKLPQFLADTVLLQPKERIQIAFVARPGDWMFHCHILEHQEHGMMGWIRVS